MYQQLGLGDLLPTQMTIQLADRSVTRPKGEIHDVLVRVGEFIYPVDFVVLEKNLCQIPIKGLKFLSFWDDHSWLLQMLSLIAGMDQ